MYIQPACSNANRGGLYNLYKENSFTFAIEVFSYCTKMYPIALMRVGKVFHPCSFPHVLVSSWAPPAPNPILESQLLQSSSLLPRIPILAFDEILSSLRTLNPSLPQWSCIDASDPISVFHVSRPSEVARYCPSAISEYRELACLLMTMNLICWPIFIPRQILEKGVFQ